jgi:hypothetical protein
MASVIHFFASQPTDYCGREKQIGTRDDCSAAVVRQGGAPNGEPRVPRLHFARCTRAGEFAPGERRRHPDDNTNSKVEDAS